MRSRSRDSGRRRKRSSSTPLSPPCSSSAARLYGLSLRNSEELGILRGQSFAAGARGVVVTLWRVTDRSAADCMTRFYRELRSGSTPAEALVQVRRAQLERGGPEAHPSRWATFVLVGGARS